MHKSFFVALVLASQTLAMTPAFAVEENNVSNGLTAAGAPLDASRPPSARAV